MLNHRAHHAGAGVPGVVSCINALCFTFLIGTARVVRSEVHVFKALRIRAGGALSGAKLWDILVTHLIPNAMGPHHRSTAFLIPGAIFSEAFLSFLGHWIRAPWPVGARWQTTRAQPF
jgi:oligopeptide transport system permease protein